MGNLVHHCGGFLLITCIRLSGWTNICTSKLSKLTVTMRSTSVLFIIALALLASLSSTQPVSNPVEEVTALKTRRNTEQSAHESEHRTLNEEVQALASKKEPASIASRSSQEQKYSNNPQEVTDKYVGHSVCCTS